MTRRLNLIPLIRLSTAPLPLLLFVTISLASVGRPQAAVTDWLDRQDPGRQVPPSAAAARDLYERARYEEARDMLDALIRAGNVTAEVLYYRGLVEPVAVVAVETYFNRVVRRYPGTEMADRALFRIAQYWYDSAFYIKARELFGEVAWHQGDSSLGQAARYWRGMTFLHEAATADTLRIGLWYVRNAARRATDPDVRGRAFLSAADISLRLTQPDSALAYSAEVLETPYLDDYHPRALSLQARAFEQLEDLEQARILYQIVAARFPDTWEGREARRWLAQQREAAVLARLDSLQAMGGPGIAHTGTGEGRWTIQVGAYSNFDNAAQIVVQLTRAGYLAWHTTKRVEGKLLVVVWVGRFETRAEANAFGTSLLKSEIITEFQLVEILPP